MGGDLTKRGWCEHLQPGPESAAPAPVHSGGDGEPEPAAERDRLPAAGRERVRLLLDHYSARTRRSRDYWALPKGTPSPDGKVVVFDSEMNDARPLRCLHRRGPAAIVFCRRPGARLEGPSQKLGPSGVLSATKESPFQWIKAYDYIS